MARRKAPGLCAAADRSRPFVSPFGTVRPGQWLQHNGNRLLSTFAFNQFLGRKDFLFVRASASGGSLLPLSPGTNPGSPDTTPVPSVWPSPEVLPPRGGLCKRKSTVCGLNGCLPRLINSRGTCHFNPQPVSLELAALALPGLLPRRFANRSAFGSKNMPSILFRPKPNVEKLRQLPKPGLSAAAHRTN
jgi:hypothetical protein